MIAPELVVERDVNDEVAVPPKVDVLEHQISPPNFPVGLRHRRDVAPLGLDPCLEAERLECVEEGLVGSFGAARVLLARVDVVTEFVDDMTSAVTHTTLPSERHHLSQWHPQGLTEPLFVLVLCPRQVRETHSVGERLILHRGLL